MKVFLLTLTLLCLLLGHAGCRSERSRQAENRTLTDAVSSFGGSRVLSAEQGRAQPQSEAQRYFDHGVDLYNKDRDREAIEAFQQATRIDPNYAEAYYRLGLAYAVVGQKEDAQAAHERAIEEYKQIIRSTPEDAAAHFTMAEAYSRLGRYEEAVKSYKQAVRLHPDDSDMYYELGLAHTKLAQYQEAVAALGKATAIDADNYRASEALEKAREGLRRREAALKRQEEAFRRQMEAALQQETTNAASTSASPTPSPNLPAGSSPSVSPSRVP